MIFALFARWGIAQRLHRPLTYIGATILAIALLWLVWTLWLRSHDREVIEDHEAGIAADVERQAVEASHAATDAADATKSRVAQENDDARNAADGSDDALRSALDRLRAGQGSGRPAAR